MKMRCAAAAAVTLASALLSTDAVATVESTPPTGLYLLSAVPGITMGAGALVTAIGASFEIDDDDPSMAWATTAIVFGSLSTISGAVYSGVVAEEGNDEINKVLIPTTVGNFALGGASLAIGIVVATLAPETQELAVLPSLGFAADGTPHATLGGSF